MLILSTKTRFSYWNNPDSHCTRRDREATPEERLEGPWGQARHLLSWFQATMRMHHGLDPDMVWINALLFDKT